MQAEEALRNSHDKLIVADAFGGLVIIQQRWESQRPLLKAFHVLFVQREAQERNDGSRITTVGVYEDLDMASTMAAIDYGVWMRIGCLRAGTQLPSSGQPCFVPKQLMRRC